jgi:hypothetical protein
MKLFGDKYKSMREVGCSTKTVKEITLLKESQSHIGLQEGTGTLPREFSWNTFCIHEPVSISLFNTA